VRCADGSRIGGDAVVIAAGAWSAPLGAALGVTLPVSARKRDVFVLETPAALPGCPLVIDPSGFWFRTEGSLILAGGPPRGEDADDVPLDAIDLDQFDAQLWPRLAARVPALEALRVRSAWAGYYEMNALDRNGLAGRLPGCANAFTACGFSGHGMQQAPAVGHSMARLIAGLDAPLIEALTPQRLLDGRPLIEANVI
jgi:glycine/D-amino acid oxidase-like deaminating enzyme